MKRIATLGLSVIATVTNAGIAEEIADKNKPYLPQKIDGMTTLVNVGAKNNAVYFIFKVNTPADNGANNKAIGDGLKGLMTEELCNGKVSSWFASGLIGYHAGYFSKDDKLMFNFSITKNDCAHPPAGTTENIKRLMEGKTK
ncbi:hypothetical protein [Limnohabitans sp. DM1]|uniref:hypothetical protein n=1 Tax=Limnohabitans sp. DM1 TaxID=1597955 RepID=UPI000B0432D4|nr:hypothetical protein [Limnohabitans sp. DM1]